MKKLLLLICIVGLANHSSAQEPELLETNWYIDYFELDNVTYNNPIVNAVGVVNSNMGFETDSAYAIMDPESDSFFTDVIYNPIDPAFTFQNMGITLPGCHAWCDFTGKYFEFLIDDFVEANFTYEIITNGDGTLTLIMTRDDENFAVFQDSKILGINDKILSNVRIYPNPTMDALFLYTENQIVKELTIYSISGKKMMQPAPRDQKIDVSLLTSGLYFLEIKTKNGSTVKRFIKE